MGALDAARILKMPISVLNKIAGSFTCDPGRYELGLQLKYKGDYCVLGYTRIAADGQAAKKSDADVWAQSTDTLTVVGSEEDEEPVAVDRHGRPEERKRYDWEYVTFPLPSLLSTPSSFTSRSHRYSPKAIRLIANYCQQFPTVVRSAQLHRRRQPRALTLFFRSLTGLRPHEGPARAVLLGGQLVRHVQERGDVEGREGLAGPRGDGEAQPRSGDDQRHGEGCRFGGGAGG